MVLVFKLGVAVTLAAGLAFAVGSYFALAGFIP